MRLFAILPLICYIVALSTTAAAQSPAPITIMTYNIHHGADAHEIDTHTSMAATINHAAPDFVGLQEVDRGVGRSHRVDQVQRLAQLTGMTPAYGEHFPYGGGSYGNAILSRHPITSVTIHRITSPRSDGTTRSLAFPVITATLPGGQPVVMSTVHLALSQPDRLLQVREILNHLKETTGPVILTGDMNALPHTPEILLHKEHFTDTDPADQFTFPVNPPVRKIDYILISKPHLKHTIRHQVLTDIHASDHLPAIATIHITTP